MPLPNRVTPFGTLDAVSARGTLMGNRGGMFHDPTTRSLRGRRWASRRWLCCSLAYSGSHRHPVWSRGYTQLFFLDEVTALAAGHRPCAECRRTDARRFQAALATSEGIPLLSAIDDRLHAERLEGGKPRRHAMSADDLPDGTVIAIGNLAFAIRGDRVVRWSHDGYRAVQARPAQCVEVVTPPTTVSALKAGYQPLWHATASQLAGRD